MPTPNNKRRNTTARNHTPLTQEEQYGRLQPQAIEFEKAVLGAMLIEKDSFSMVSDILKPKSFYDPRHQKIYQVIEQLSMAEKPVDILTVTEQLNTNGELEDVGGPFYISQLSTSVASSAHIQYHARIIAQKAMARELISFASRIQGQAFDPTIDVDKLMQEAEGGLFELSQENLKKDYEQIDPIVREAYDNITLAAGRGAGLSGIPSLFNDIDKITGGWQNSDLIILAARPAMGKTAFALSMAKNIAIDQKIPVAFFSLEMSNLQLVNRIISNVCEIESSKIRSGDLNRLEWGQLDYKIQSLYGMPLYVDDTAQLSVFELRTKARRLYRQHGVRLIIIDYLQLMNAQGMSYNSRQEEVSTISRSLKGLAKELNIPIIALSQLNRSVESRDASKGAEGKQPQLSDLRESGAIEQDADIVCFIHRPEYYKIYSGPNNEDLRGKAELIIAKHRNGAVGSVYLNFNGKYARFSNIENQDIPFPGQENALLQSAISGNDAPPLTEELPPPGGSPFPPPEADAFPPPESLPY